MLKKHLILSSSLLLLLGCSTHHSGMKGSVALKINPSKGIACLFGDNPEIGDKLILYTNDCSSLNGREGNSSCKMVKSGEASITRLVNDHYAEFETKADVPFEEGTIITLKN
jgi:hypothetical protein